MSQTDDNDGGGLFRNVLVRTSTPGTSSLVVHQFKYAHYMTSRDLAPSEKGQPALRSIS
jgi:hypothetical protein